MYHWIMYYEEITRYKRELCRKECRDFAYSQDLERITDTLRECYDKCIKFS